MKKNYNSNTTDSQDEMLIEVTRDDKVIGPVSRYECHKEIRKPWHRSTHIYLFRPNGDLFLSQRSLTKDTAPGEWSVSAGGHVDWGETYKECAENELYEELKLKLNLEFIDKLTVDYGSEREIIQIYSGVTEKCKYYKKDEMQQVKAFEFEKVITDFCDGRFDLSGGSRDSFKHVVKTGSLRKFRNKMIKNRYRGI